ncbi:MAG: chromosome segregation protein SMC [Pseudomonadota bacterium]|nr:chromosome segregation protein SMC [Pseudomonadota bacterium]
MRLKKIKINGFKSFLEPTAIDLNTNMAAIVGPNGCGKSNVIEALTWVLGETSAKQLRGGMMDDVIFNGNDSKNPIGRASVELILENTKNLFINKYASFSEISVKRELDRNAASNYSINGVRCRRRDVADLFLGTGLGSKQQYSIIGQGTVSQIVESKPDDLRLFIEEAAGVSRYKERKRETLNKIKNVNDNLERLKDIKFEVEKQLKRLDRQAKGAESYKKLKAEEARIKALLSGCMWNEYDNTRSAMLKKKHVSETSLTEEKDSLKQLETEFDLNNLRLNETLESINQLKEESYKSDAVVSQLRSQYEMNQQSHVKLKNQLLEKTSSLNSLEQEIANERVELKEFKLMIEDADRNYEIEYQQFKKDKEKLGSVSEKVTESFNAIRQIDGEKSALTQEKETTSLEIEFAAQIKVQKTSEIETLSKLIKDNSANKYESDSILLEEKISKINLDREKLLNQLKECRSEIKKTRDLLSLISTDIHEKQKVLEQEKGKLSSLKAIQAQALGENDSQVSDWIKNNKFENKEKLLESIKITRGWEIAFEKSFSLPLNTFLVKEEEFEFSQIDVTDIPVDVHILIQDSANIDSKVQLDSANSLNHIIEKASDSVRDLSNHIEFFETNLEAYQASKNLSYGQVAVSKLGLVFGKNWFKLPASTVNNPSLILQNTNIEKLKREIEELSGVLAKLEARRADIDLELTKLFQAETKLNDQISEIESNLLKEKELYIKTRTKITELERESNLAKEKFSQIENEMIQLNENMNRFRDKSKLCDEKLKSLQVNEQTAIDRNKMLVREQGDLNKKIESLTDLLEKKKNQIDKINISINSLNNSISLKNKRMDEFAIEKNKIEGELNRLPKFSEEEPSEIKDQIILRETLSQELSKKSAELNDIEIIQKKINARKKELLAKIDLIKNDLVTLQVEIAALQTKQENLAQTEEFDPGLLNDKAALESVNIDDLNDQLSRISKKVERLGPINLAAIDEFDELESRRLKLDKEISDLSAALSTLGSAMRKIEQETKTRFSTMYGDINRDLKGTFVELFGGGNARLELTSDDMLEAGVSIVARPPGKRNTSIHQLSGGEKALTALALIFTIFKLKPSPFCLLDEVDAPLDDNNTLRFSTMLKKMSSYVQFVYVTHNKITMEAAEQLLGVTMEEAGVSRLVDVNIVDAIKLAEPA